MSLRFLCIAQWWSMMWWHAQSKENKLCFQKQGCRKLVDKTWLVGKYLKHLTLNYIFFSLCSQKIITVVIFGVVVFWWVCHSVSWCIVGSQPILTSCALQHPLISVCLKNSHDNIETLYYFPKLPEVSVVCIIVWDIGHDNNSALTMDYKLIY